MRAPALGTSRSHTLDTVHMQPTRPLSGSRSFLVVHAGPRRPPGSGSPAPGGPKKRDSGFFADADPNGTKKEP